MWANCKGFKFRPISCGTYCWGFIIENVYYVNFGIRDSFTM